MCLGQIIGSVSTWIIISIRDIKFINALSSIQLLLNKIFLEKNIAEAVEAMKALEGSNQAGRVEPPETAE